RGEAAVARVRDHRRDGVVRPRRGRSGDARRSDDYGGRIGGPPHGRDPRRQYADDGSRISDAGRLYRSVGRRRCDDLRDDRGPRARARRSRRAGPRGGCRRRGAGREFCGRADLHRGPVGVQPSGGDDGAPLRVDAGLSRPEPAIGGRRLTTGMEGSLMRAAIFLALLSLFPAGCVDIVGADIQQVVREQKHFSTTGKPEVVLSTFDGSIEIRPWDKPDVQVIVEKRSEEHTSELQSRFDLVCRLLLEKKKNTYKIENIYIFLENFICHRT